MDAEAASCKELVLGGHSNRTTFAVDWFACNVCSVQYVKYIKLKYHIMDRIYIGVLTSRQDVGV